MASRLDIIFNGGCQDFDTLNITTFLSFTFRTNRLNSFVVSIDSNPYTQATFFIKAFQSDLNANGNGQFTVTRETVGLNEKVSILHPNDGFFDTASENSAGITFTIENGVEVPNAVDFYISLSPSDSNQCQKIKATIFADEICDEIYFRKNGITQGSAINVDTYALDFQRGDVISAYTKKDGLTREKIQPLPPPFIIERVIVEGQNIRIKLASGNVTSLDSLNFTYSLDNVDFSPSPVFTGLLEGTYTAYAKDQYGCTKTLDFEVFDLDETEVNFAPPYLDVPRINSIPFVDRRLPNVSETNNQFEFLSSEIPDPYTHKNYCIPICENDFTTIQFRSSYKNNFVKWVDCQGNETDIPFEKKSDFLNKVRILQGNLSNVNGFLRVSYSTGSVYDDQGNEIDTHTYNGSLPVDYEVGTVLFIENYGQAVITGFEEVGGVNFAVTNLTTNVTIIGTKITDITKVYNFEVYEAYFQNDTFGSDPFYLKIGSNDTGIQNKTFVSELIQVVPDIEKRKFHKVIYYSKSNRENNDIHYQWGIQHTRWVSFHKYLDPLPSAEIEILQSDDRVNKKNYSAKRVYVLETGAMPKMIADSLAEALNISTVINIDGQDYINEEPCELEVFGSQAVVRVNVTVSNKMFTYGQDEGVFNNDQFYPVLTD